ncbi:MAG: hypothetical protein ACPGPS_20095 [Rubripirellula sp.]
MSTFIKWIAAPILAVGLLTTTDTPQAEAQSFSFGSRGLSIQVGQRYPSYYSRVPSCSYPRYDVYNSYRYQYGSPIRRSYGHYHYYPTDIYRHRNYHSAFPGYYKSPFGPHYRHGRHH